MSLIFEKSVEGRHGYQNPPSDVPLCVELPDHLKRATDCPLPEVSELDVVRHFTKLSQKNYSVDTQFYPLGSCTMKYNPKFMEKIAQMSAFADIHPLLPQLRHGEKFTQGSLQVLYETEQLLSELTGMDHFTMQPLAGAHGELTGVMMFAAYHKAKGNKKKYIIVPDSSHGTNPATSAVAGYESITVPSDASGSVDFEALKKHVTDETAGMMLTSPNTHGIFNSNIDKIVDLIHSVDGLMYYDGANLNAVMGRCRPGDIGFDAIHLNVHKTLATPHGGGGPGAGPVGVNKKLEPFLPIPRVGKNADGSFFLNDNYPDSIGYVAPFYGNFGIILRAYVYLLILGKQGIKDVSDQAVLNANYIRARLKTVYDLPYDRICMHECVFSASKQAARGVTALDISKYLIDQDIHPPTVYFPLTVKEAMMVEPTETESKETMDRFIDAMIGADKLSQTNPEKFQLMPKKMPVSRPDETRAAREIQTNYFDT